MAAKEKIIQIESDRRGLFAISNYGRLFELKPLNGREWKWVLVEVPALPELSPEDIGVKAKKAKS